MTVYWGVRNILESTMGSMKESILEIILYNIEKSIQEIEWRVH